MRISTAYRYKFLKDYRIGVPEILSDVTYQGNIIFNESDLRKSIGWIPDSFFYQMGQDIDGEAANDKSGYSVSMNSLGNRVAIGAINNTNTNGGFFSGQTRIYELIDNSWIQLGQDIDGEEEYDFSGFSVSLNDVGNRVVIGAIYNDGNGNSSGHARIYELIDNSWVQLGQDIDGEVSEDQSGWSVSINSLGNRVAIGAIYNSDNELFSGQTRIYELIDNSWIQLGQDINGEGQYDNSGYSVSMNSLGDRVAIGVIEGINEQGYFSGHTRIYELIDNSWVQLGQNINGEEDFDNSGYSVSLNATGNRVAIGAINNDENGNNSGQTRIYELIDNSWVQLGPDINGEAAGDNSGYSVSLNATGNRVAIGAINNDENGNNSGQTRIYELIDNSWVQLGPDINGEAAGDNSGYSVSLNATGNRVAIGAINNDGKANNSGSVKIFNLTPLTLDKPFTSFNDENINVVRPTWKYVNNLNIIGGWYDNLNKQFITNLEETNLSASINSNKFTSPPNDYKGYKWIEVATKKNTNISLSSIQLSSIYFKLTGFAPKKITDPLISWTYNSNVITPTVIYNNIFRDVVPNFTTLSTQNLENLFIDYTPEIPLTSNQVWRIGNTDKYFTQNATLIDYDGAASVRYSISAYSYKNVIPLQATSYTIYTASTAFFNFANKSTSSLRSRLTSVTPLTSTRNLFTVQNRTANIFIRNPQLWCADLTDQLTALVVQKLGTSVYSYGGILITPRHLLYVQHAFPRTERVRFVTSDNKVISAAPIGSSDAVTFKNDLPIASLSSVDTNYQDIGIVTLDRDVSLSGIHVMPIAAITPTERTILRLQYIPTLLCSQSPGRATGSTNPNAISASNIQMTINSTNFLNMTTAWGSISANPFYNWDTNGGGYKLWDGDSGNAHLLFCNDKLYIYSTTKFTNGNGAIVSALSGAINHLIEKSDLNAGINTGLKPTYYTLDEIVDR